MKKITNPNDFFTEFYVRTKLIIALMVLMFVLSVNSNAIAIHKNEAISNFIPPVTVPCNTDLPVPITSLNYSDLSVSTNTTGICVVGCGIADEDNIIDTDATNSASVSTLIGLGVTHAIRVTDNTLDEFYTAGSFAGFLIENSSVLQADLLDAIVVRTYLEGVEQESNTGTSLATIGSTLLGADQYYVGFHTTENFDAVEISISSLVGVLSTTNVYHAVTNSFCPGPDLECNTATRLTKPDFSVRVVEEHTGTGGLLTLGGVNDINRAIDSNPNNYATIDLLAGVAGTASIAFKDELTDYPAATYAGFDIENASVLSTDLLDAITITTYLDGVQVESKMGNTELVPADSGLLLTGSQSIRLGFITTQPFDEVQLSLNQLVSLDLGSTRVYGMVLQTFCPGTINCDEPYVLSNPSDSVIINNDNTGIDGVACVACEVDNAVNAISEDTSDFALINIVAGVAGTASLSVQDVLTDYPVGTEAGFVIRDTNDLLQADLLNALTITTYLDGVQQEQQTANNLLALEALGLVNITPTTTDSFYVVKFTTTLSFDEMQLTVGSLVGTVNSLEVYGAYIDTTNTTFCDQAEIALVKQGVVNDENGDGCTDVGETITYTFTLTNQGNISINSIVINDPLLGGDIVAVPTGDNGDSILGINETWVYTVSYTITQEDIDSGSVSNQATVTGTSAGGVGVSDLSDDDNIAEDDITETTLCQSADIALIKTGVFNDADGDSCSDVGETITYTFTVTNQGNVSIANVILDDPLLGGALALSSGDTDADNELDVTETWIYTSDYAITQTDIDAGSVSNQATVTGMGAGGAGVSDLSDDDSIIEDESTETTLCQSADIALIKTGVFNDADGDSCSDVGETITYTFTVTNQGNVSIANVILDDPLLGGALALSSGDTDADNELDVTETWIYTSDYAITQTDIDAGSVSNQATVTGTSAGGVGVSDLSDDDNIAEDDITETTLCQSSDIALIKTAIFNDTNNDGCSDVGETITYTFTVTNQGNVSIASVVLDDPLLGGALALSSGDTDADNELDVTETWIYTSDYTITQTDIDMGSVSNQAVVVGTSTLGVDVSDLSDDNSILEDDTTETPLCIPSAISLEKVGVFNDENGSGAVQVGETITYTFTVYNTGEVTLYNINIQDPLPGIVIQGGPIAQLLPGESDSTTFAAIYTVLEEDLFDLIVTNQATVTAEDILGNPVADTSDDPNNLENIDINNDGEPDDPTVINLPGVLGSNFEIFNGITPDGDGLNDFFLIEGIENYPDNTLKIYNRWGVLVYETEGYGVNGKVFRGLSDGRVTVNRSEELPTGTYFYILTRRVTNQDPLTNQGYLYIKRK